MSDTVTTAYSACLNNGFVALMPLFNEIRVAESDGYPMFLSVLDCLTVPFVGADPFLLAGIGNAAVAYLAVAGAEHSTLCDLGKLVSSSEWRVR